MSGKPIQKNAIVRASCTNFAALAPFGCALFEAAATLGNGDDIEIARSRIFAYLDMLDMTDKVRAFCAHDHTRYLGYSNTEDYTFMSVDPSGARVKMCVSELPIAPIYYEGITQVSNYLPVVGYLLYYRLTLPVLREILTQDLVELIPQAVLDRALVQHTSATGGRRGGNPELLSYIKGKILSSKLPKYIKSRIVPTTGAELIYAEKRRQTDPKEI